MSRTQLVFDNAKKVPLDLRDKIASACGAWGYSCIPYGDRGLVIRFGLDSDCIALGRAQRLCDAFRVAYQSDVQS